MQLPLETVITISPITEDTADQVKKIQQSLPKSLRTVPGEARFIDQIPGDIFESGRYSHHSAKDGSTLVNPGESKAFDALVRNPNITSETYIRILAKVKVSVSEVPWTSGDRIHQVRNTLSRWLYDRYDPIKQG